MRLWRAGGDIPALEQDGRAGSAEPDGASARPAAANGRARGARRGDGRGDGQDEGRGEAPPGFRYVSYNALVVAARAALLRHGVLMLPSVIGHEREGRNRTILTVETVFACPDRPEDRLSVRTVGYGNDPADHGAAKAFTRAVKQALAKALCLTTHDPPEAEAEGASGVVYEETGDADRLAAAEQAARASLEAWARAFRAALEALDDPGDVARLRREHADVFANPALPEGMRAYLNDRVRERRAELERDEAAPKGEPEREPEREPKRDPGGEP